MTIFPRESDYSTGHNVTTRTNKIIAINTVNEFTTSTNLLHVFSAHTIGLVSTIIPKEKSWESGLELLHHWNVAKLQ